MKKNSIIMIGASIAMAASIAIGGTLAYYTSEKSDIRTFSNDGINVEQIILQRKDGVGHIGLAEEGDLVPFVQEQKLFPAYPKTSDAYTAEQTELFYWGSYVTADSDGKEVTGAGNGLWDDNNLKGAMDKFVFVKNHGADCYYRTVFAFECPEGMEYSQGADKEFMMNVNGHSLFTWDKIGYTEINGSRYLLMVATYNVVLASGEISRPSLLQVVMTDNVTSEQAALLGDTYEILAYTQAIQAANLESLTAADALKLEFADITTTEHPWKDGIIADDESDLNALLAKGGDVVVGDDIDLTSDVTAITKDANIVLGDNIITATGRNNNDHTTADKISTLVIGAGANVTLDAENGGVKNDEFGYGITVGGGNLTINGGNYSAGGATVVQVSTGTLTINGGYFDLTGANKWDYNYLINCIDANYNNGTAKVVITGGTFKGWNPANNTSEGAGTNFVAEGYEVVDNGDNTYTVVAK